MGALSPEIWGSCRDVWRAGSKPRASACAVEGPARLGCLSSTVDFSRADLFWRSSERAWRSYPLVAIQDKDEAGRDARYAQWSSSGRVLERLGTSIREERFSWKKIWLGSPCPSVAADKGKSLRSCGRNALWKLRHFGGPETRSDERPRALDLGADEHEPGLIRGQRTPGIAQRRRSTAGAGRRGRGLMSD